MQSNGIRIYYARKKRENKWEIYINKKVFGQSQSQQHALPFAFSKASFPSIMEK